MRVSNPNANVPEHWRVDVGDADVAVLQIPPALKKARIFDLDVRFVVQALPEGPPAWLAIDVEVDGVRQWSRRIDAHLAGAQDSLDYHCRRELPAGQGLRVRAMTRTGGARRRSLRIDAEQVLEDEG